MDQQSNLTKGLGKYNEAKQCPVMIDLVDKNAEPEDSILSVMPGLDLVPSRLDNVVLDAYLMINRKNLAGVFNTLFNDIFKRYDLIIFDCPPNLHPATCSAILSSDLVITPLNPDIYSYDGLEVMDKELNNISQQFNTEINWKILLNKFDSRTVLSSSYLSKILQEDKLASRLLKSVIRTSQEFPNIKSKEKTIFDSLRKSTAKEDIDALTKEIIQMMQKETVKTTEVSSIAQ